MDCRDGSNRDNFGESLETLSAVQSLSWVSFWAKDFLNLNGLAYGFLLGGGGAGVCLPFSLLSIFYSWIFSLFVFLIYFNETYSKQSKIYRKMLRKKFVNQKSQNFSQMFVISIKKTLPYSLDLKIYSLAYCH